MTEKRFMVDDAGELIDLNNHKFVDYGDEVCNLLNELSEENEQLKISLSGTVEKNRKLQTILDKLGYEYIGDLR